MKRTGVFLAAAGVCACFYAIGAEVNGVSVIDEIVAKVNGDIITRGELEHTRKQLDAELRQQGIGAGALPAAIAEKEKDLLRDRVDQLLLIQKAKDLNINVDPELSKYMAEIQKEYKISDPDKFHDFVREKTGMSYEDFRNETKNSMLTQRVIRQEVGGKLSPKREEIQKYYDAHKTEFVREERAFLREILVSTEGKDAAGQAAAEKKAKDLVARAKKGERFAEMARDNSDAVTAKQFGDLGGFKKGELNKTIEDMIWDKPKGFVSDPLKVDSGYLILKVDEHQKQGQAELAEVENEITERLAGPQMQPKVREYLTGLRKTAFLEIKPGWADSGAAAGMDTTWKDPATLKPETVTKAEVVTKTRHKKLLWAIPIPGTKTKDTSTSK
jgi:parvulin-like peptidyl-prolyl isomerase